MDIYSNTHLFWKFNNILGADVHNVEQIVEEHLKTLIVQNFDAKKADSIFTEEGGVSNLLTNKLQFLGVHHMMT